MLYFTMIYMSIYLNNVSSRFWYIEILIYRQGRQVEQRQVIRLKYKYRDTEQDKQKHKQKERE